VGVSPDGTRLVTMREVQLEPFVLGSTSLWSMPGGKLVADLGGWFKHFGNAGSRVTTNEAIWDARTGLRVADAPFSAVWSPDGTHFVTQHDPPGQVWRLDLGHTAATDVGTHLSRAKGARRTQVPPAEDVTGCVPWTSGGTAPLDLSVHAPDVTH